MDGWGDTSYGSHNNSFANSSHNHSSAGGGGGAAGASRSKVSVSAQLEITGLPADTDCNVIRGKFGRYGRISRIVLDHSMPPTLLFSLNVIVCLRIF